MLCILVLNDNHDDEMLSQIFPIFCIGCNRFNQYLCGECAQSLFLAETQHRPGFSFQAVFEYQQTMAELLNRVKERNHFGYIPVLSRYLQTRLDLDCNSQVLIPPSTKKAFRKRGFVPSLELAKHAGLNVTKKLVRVKQTAAQQSLDFERRQQNQHRAFRLVGPGRYLLFDDVITSGATINEMSRAVIEGGGEVVGVVALCATAQKGAN